MVFPTVLICSTAFALAAARLTGSPDAPVLLGRADVTLADGTSMQYGALAPEGLEWQSSGVLVKGGCSSTLQFITDCYELELGGDPSQELDPGYATARQRIEFLTPH
ncbi:hypothetical protein FIBSPDRAFT_962253 [Athelia psychrophila]|uniref:Uncharacterized protein n=1 Tax=Athelia psychrophila TaxID=1759441 RepID=A0A166ADI1_9AGAM|nr:hypothetical protein FIBSPDRAFT_962253 [Fibularhizoctonia sp. CBS 109695]